MMGAKRAPSSRLVDRMVNRPHFHRQGHVTRLHARDFADVACTWEPLLLLLSVRCRCFRIRDQLLGVCLLADG
jgi:hypothetical protein